MPRASRDEWLDEKDKRESKKSLFYFGKFILGYDLYINPHRDICDFVQSCGESGLLLLPRGSFKTTIVSQIYPLWLLINNPNIRILLDSEVLRNSERNLGVIKRTLQGHQRFIQLFGDMVQPNTWTNSEITIKGRTNLALKESTINTSSVDTVEVGPHYDVIIPDDLHSEKNSKTKDQIDHVYEHFRLLFSLLEPDGIMRLIGTRWADLDVYGRIIENHKEFKIVTKKAIQDDGTLFFPARLSHKVLDRIRKAEGPDMFSAQYQNDPVPVGEAANFHRHNFKYGTDTSIPLYITVDPSISESLDSDYFAIVAGGLNRANDLYIEDYIYGRFKPHIAIEKIFNLYDRYRSRVKGIGIEINAFQRMFKFAFDIEMKKRNKWIKIYELRHSKSKDERILSLQPRYEAGSVYHHPRMKDGELEEELLKFPRGRRDDLIDAEAALLEIIKPHSYSKGKIEHPLKSQAESAMENTISYLKLHQDWRKLQKQGKKYVHSVMGDQW